jgi:hypothetical protein
VGYVEINEMLAQNETKQSVSQLRVLWGMKFYETLALVSEVQSYILQTVFSFGS